MNFLLSIFICAAIGSTKHAGRVGEHEQLLLKDSNNAKDQSFRVKDSQVPLQDNPVGKHFCMEGPPPYKVHDSRGGCGLDWDFVVTSSECENVARSLGVEKKDPPFEDGDGKRCYWSETDEKLVFGSSYRSESHESRRVCKTNRIAWISVEEQEPSTLLHFQQGDDVEHRCQTEHRQCYWNDLTTAQAECRNWNECVFIWETDKHSPASYGIPKYWARTGNETHESVVSQTFTVSKVWKLQDV